MKSAKYFVVFGTCGRSVDEHQHSLRDEPLEITRGGGGGECLVHWFSYRIYSIARFNC